MLLPVLLGGAPSPTFPTTDIILFALSLLGPAATPSMLAMCPKMGATDAGMGLSLLTWAHGTLWKLVDTSDESGSADSDVTTDGCLEKGKPAATKYPGSLAGDGQRTEGISFLASSCLDSLVVLGK